MSRARAVTMSVPTSVPEWQAVAHRLVPLWRHGVWLVALFALLTLWVDITVDVQQLRADLDRSNRAQREARIQNERLRLELDARRRALVLETLAGQLATGAGATVVVVGAETASDTSGLVAGGPTADQERP